MIHYYSIRNDDRSTISQRDREIVDATWGLLKYELGYGGIVTRLDVTGDKIEIEVHTQVMSARDKTIFSGPKKEMQVLVAGVEMHQHVFKCNVDELYERCKQVLGPLVGSPLYLTHSAGMIKGGMFGGHKKLRLCLLTAVLSKEIETEQLTKEQIEHLLALETPGVGYVPNKTYQDDQLFLSFVELLVEGHSYKEVLALAA